MKKLLYVFSAVIFLSACNQAPKTAEEAKDVKTTSTEATVFTVDKSASTVKWEGAKITETVHFGTVNISEGSLAVKDGQLDAGSFTLDMNSVVALDLTEDDGKLKLEGHLKSGDFFMTETYPTAKFEITAVEAAPMQDGSTHKISGNLTIKDVTNGISFPAKVTITDAMAEASAKFLINRNEWGVVWGGTKTEQGIKDFLQNNLIKDEIAFDVTLKAAK
jgi:polyisoprenoid-binding protein YceI